MVQSATKNFDIRKLVFSCLLATTAVLSGCGGSSESEFEQIVRQSNCVTADQVYSDYQNNEVAAQQKYEGRINRICGVVDEIELNLFNQPVISLDASLLGSVSIEGIDTASAANISKGSVAVFECNKINELLGNPVLTECSIVPIRNEVTQQQSTIETAVLNTEAVSSCYNLDKSEPAELAGTLEYVMFAGPPNYEDVQKGDMPEPSFILRMNKQICIADYDGFADPSDLFDQVQVVPGQVGPEELRKMVGQYVTVGLYDQMAAHTAHHRRPLVAWVSKISAAPISSRYLSNGENSTADYGTAATTIRAFYSALGSGQGGVAASMVVPEKTANGPFSAKELTRYYGNMRSAIELLSVSPRGANAYTVRYKYGVAKTLCNGRAVVEMTKRNGRDYIARIRALDGC
jgi:hypothetical protein